MLGDERGWIDNAGELWMLELRTSVIRMVL
jgi:hypothetical protein